MRHRNAFTLVEMMVVIALTLFIMVILTQAFSAGLDVFRELMSIGDLQKELRGVSTLLRNDLGADHFEGKRRLSESNGTNTIWNPRPREGFVRVWQGGASVSEDTTLMPPSYYANSHSLHLTVKLRGNNRDNIFTATVPPGSPLLDPRVTFFSLPQDGRFQETPLGQQSYQFASPWAEVAYFLVKTGTTTAPFNPNAATGTPLFSLYRVQFLVVPDNDYLNGHGPGNITGAPLASSAANQYPALSWKVTGKTLYFNNPNDLTTQGNRRFNPVGPSINGTAVTINNVNQFSGATLLLSNVVSFDVQTLRSTSQGSPLQSPPAATAAGFADLSFDTANNLTNCIRALSISIRIWDQKTTFTQQVTVIQDM